MSPVLSSSEQISALNIYRCKQSGFTLIELMISMLIGLIAIGAAGTLFLTTVQGNNAVILSTRLNSELEGILTLVTNDLRRAGYWGVSQAGVNGINNPFTQDTSDIIIDSYNGESCVLYSYDSNDNGVLDTNEYFGYRIDSGSVSMRTSATASPENCGSGNWSPLTLGSSSEAFTITEFLISDVAISASTSSPTFPAQPANSRCLNASVAGPGTTLGRTCTSTTSGDSLAIRRAINIRVAGQSSSDSTISSALIATVVVSNDRMIQVSP